MNMNSPLALGGMTNFSHPRNTMQCNDRHHLVFLHDMKNDEVWGKRCQFIREEYE